jgi:lysophospholipase L1-like esterase
MSSRNRKFNNQIAVLCVAMLHWHIGVAQHVTRYSELIDERENVIHNAGYLEPFFEKLHELKSEKTQTVNIVHIGDSHIQADFLTEVVRRKLQEEFGNAGRGLVFPGRVAGTNEPLNFRSSSSSVWAAKRIVHPSKPLPVGISGITIATDQPGATFSLRLNDAAMDYSFNAVAVFMQSDEHSFTWSVRDSSQVELARLEAASMRNTHHAKVTVHTHQDHVEFKVEKQNESQTHATFFGLSLENGRHGLLYHAIGVNGAKYEHYNKAHLLIQQTSLLTPDLIIISLGTNESVEYPNINGAFFNQISRFVEALRAQNPEAQFILVTPPDAFIRKVRRNPGISLVRDHILQFCVEHGIAFWDMFKVNGGDGAARQWRNSGLLRPDGIHFTKDGYALQGTALFAALMKSYNAYVSDRHP